MIFVLPAFTHPSGVSTLVFLAVVAAVCAALLASVWYAYRGCSNRLPVFRRSVLGLLAWLWLSHALAHSGAFERLAGTVFLGVPFVLFNAGAVALALSSFGQRLSQQTPLAALVGFQAFRLPLELVLHSWYTQGSLPRQMTYLGHNFDIASGGLALAATLVLPLLSGVARWRVAAAVSVVSSGLLVAVMSIAMRSAPWPLRTYEEGAPILLMFHSPYIWILPVCVCGALFVHVLTFRRLWADRLRD